MKHDILVDPLTGGLSQYGFNLQASERAAEIFAAGKTPYLIFGDIVGMKHINNRLGYYSGDQVIVKTSEIIGAVFDQALWSRYDNDHFLILDAEGDVVDKIQKAAHIISLIDSGVDMKFGYYVMQAADENIALACDKAKMAEQAIHNDHRMHVNAFQESLFNEYFLKNYVKNNLHKAMEKGEIEVYYQPIIHTMSLQTSSLEALARWNSQEMGMISPGVFIPVLEDEHMSADLDLHIVEQVLKEFGIREKAGMILLPVSVNISQTDLETKDMVKEICALTDRYGVDRRYLIIEITESACIENPEVLKETIDRFHNAGFQVWMDDFGSGYSSLNNLQKFDFDLIKLDMRFMEDFNFSSKGAVVLRHLIQMAEELSIDTLVEGVETRDQLIFLKSIGALRMQGYYFCKPHPLSHYLTRVKESLGLVMNEKVSSYYSTITKETRTMTELPPELQERMKALPQAILEENEGTIIFLKSNAEYIEYLVHNGIIDPTVDYDESAKNWRVPIPESMSQAVKASKESKQWTRFDDNGNLGYVCFLTEDEERQATAFRIILY